MVVVVVGEQVPRRCLQGEGGKYFFSGPKCPVEDWGHGVAIGFAS